MHLWQPALQGELLNISLAALITSTLLAACIFALTPPHAFHRFSRRTADVGKTRAQIIIRTHCFSRVILICPLTIATT